MSNDFAMFGLGAICTTFYLLMGLGTSRAVSAMRKEPMRMFCIAFWPVVLVVIAACGDVSFED